MTKRKSSAEWRESATTLRQELQALYTLSEKEGLSEDDQSRFDELVADDGPIQQAEAGAEKAAQVEELMRQHAEKAREDASIATPAVGPYREADNQAAKKDDGRIHLRGQKSRYFADARQAKAGAEWLASTVATGSERQSHIENAVRFGGEEYAAQSIGTDGKGGHLVPTPLASEIIKQRDAVAVAPQLCRQFSMTAETLKFNRETGDVSVVYPGESTTITDSDVDYTPHTLTVVKRAALVKMSREFIADVNVGALDEIIDNLGYRFAYAMDNEFINGDGSGTYGGETGLIGAVNTGNRHTAGTGDDTIAELDLTDFVQVKKNLPHKFQEGAAWLMKPDAWYHVEQLLMTAGGAATAEFANGLSGSRTFMGKPVFLSDLFPAEAGDAYVAFYGNFRQGVACGDRNDMSIVTSTERFFDDDDVAVRATHRYDLLVFNNAAIASLQLAS